jgi:hypothetical protein
MKTPRLQVQAHLRVRALSLLAACVVAASVLTAAVAPAFATVSA